MGGQFDPEELGRWLIENVGDVGHMEAEVGDQEVVALVPGHVGANGAQVDEDCAVMHARKMVKRHIPEGACWRRILLLLVSRLASASGCGVRGGWVDVDSGHLREPEPVEPGRRGVKSAHTLYSL